MGAVARAKEISFPRTGRSHHDIGDSVNVPFFVPEHPRLVPADGAAVQPPGGRVGGAAQEVQVPPAGLHPQLGHGRAGPPRPLPDADAGPPVLRGPGGQGAGRYQLYERASSFLRMICGGVSRAIPYTTKP